MQMEISEEDIESMKAKILELVKKYEKKFGRRIHISDWRYDHLIDKTDFDITMYFKSDKK